ncbi:flagellin [Pseudoalteromonas sp. BSi20495]|nr:flagellin [Pseudoalteromonas sp. BSi20495]
MGVNDAVSRIRELSIQAGNGAFNNDRDALQDEVAQLQSQITDTFVNASFAGKTLFDGQSVSFQIGQDVNAVHSFTAIDRSIASVISGINISTQDGARAAIDISDKVGAEINNQRVELGAFENTLSNTIRGLDEKNENISASKNRIQDTDYAKAISQQISNDFLTQASIALRGQANQSAEAILVLL